MERNRFLYPKQSFSIRVIVRDSGSKLFTLVDDE